MIATMIAHCRKANHMTQEAMAAQFGVSRQSIQKWESGTSVPEIGKLVEIAEYFHITLDQLIRGSDSRSTEELRHAQTITPSFETLHTWENYSCNMTLDWQQSWEEGKDVESLRGLCGEIAKLPSDQNRDRMADTLFEMLLHAPQRSHYPYYEPSDYESIQRASRHSEAVQAPPRAELKEKIKGAWLGRICGCLLGKPIECIKLDELIPLLKETDNYPMRRYLLQKELPEERCRKYQFNLRGRCYPDTISCAPADDDTNYLVLACKLVEDYGRGFTSRNVAELWLASQPKDAYCTAERVAFHNFVNGFLPPDSAWYKNPYREWIGAQIRGDYFGYINPGNPEAAAEMAYRDACISHVKNGIYGEMFIAAMLAKAAVCQDMLEIIRAGMDEIPPTSRLHEQLRQVLDSYLAGNDFSATMRLVYDQFDDKNEHHWCHVISNAMIVAAALLYGEYDYGRTICLAVQSGFDTDCNGATAGSIVGMVIGAGRIPEAWTRPLHGQLETEIFRMEKVRLDDMVELTLKHIAMAERG